MNTKRLRVLLLLGTYPWTAGLLAQTPSDLNEGSLIEQGPIEDSFQFSWWSRANVTYFLQSSEDLMDWQFFRLIEPGDEEIAAWGFSTTADGLFLRLNYVEEISPDPWNADHDGDLIGSYHELLLGSNPLEPTEPLNPSGDDDSDLIDNAEDALPGDAAVGKLTIAITFPGPEQIIQ